MKILSQVLALAIATIYILSVCQGQMGGTGTGQCMDTFDQQLNPRCFQPRNLNFSAVLAVVTQNTSGSLPPEETIESYRQKICPIGQLDFVIPCMLQFKATFTNATCTQEEVEAIETSGRVFLTVLEQACTEPCERFVQQQLGQCFASVQLDPNILRTNVTADKFSFLGNTSADAERFCGIRTQLFTCMKTVISSCPSSVRRLYEMGLDIEAMERTSQMLCPNRQSYLKALQCFMSPNQQIGMCQQQSLGQLMEVLVGRGRTGTIAPSKLVTSLCGVRLNQVMCELQVYRQTCEASHVQLKNMVECSILPEPCIKEATFQAGLTQLCKSVDVTTKKTTPGRPPTTPSKPHLVTKEPGRPVDGGGSSAITASGLLAFVSLLILLVC